MPTPSEEVEVLDHSERVFHVEALRGGMNRLLLRSNRSATWPTRVEVIFMNVAYVAVGTSLTGLRVVRQRVPDPRLQVPWNLPLDSGLSVFCLSSNDGEGLVVAGACASDESEAGADQPSRFFMMD